MWMLLIKMVNIDSDTLELLLLMSIVDRQLCFSKELTITAVKLFNLRWYKVVDIVLYLGKVGD